jgi:RNA polymerase sigma-70 factor (ECF subfamily)
MTTHLLDRPNVAGRPEERLSAVPGNDEPRRNRKNVPLAGGSDPAAWVKLYGDYIFRYALMRVRNRDLAENLVQETFLAALSGRRSFGGRSAERTWMIGILKHKIIDHYRKSFREKSVSELQIDEEQTVDEFYDAVGHPKQYPRDWMPDPEVLLHSKEFWATFRRCLNRLPKQMANAFTMRELEDLSTGEICAKLGITPTNLWVMLHRARLQLRALLEKEWFEKEASPVAVKSCANDATRRRASFPSLVDQPWP